MDNYAVFGNPIEQSKSPEIHSIFAKQTKQKLNYVKILGSLEKFSDSLEAFFSDPSAKGCNVTAPFKQDAAKWVSSLSESAKFGEAVNTIIKQEDGSFTGDNTDGVGLVTDILTNGVEIKNASILLLGAGGAARGVLKDIAAQSPSNIVIANRTAAKAEALASLLPFAKVQGMELSHRSFDSIAGHFDIIINSTSASLSSELPDVPDTTISQASMVYDMVYGKQLSKFLQHAKKLGVPKTIDGLGMLVEQASESFHLWRGVRPDTSEVVKKLREQF